MTQVVVVVVEVVCLGWVKTIRKGAWLTVVQVGIVGCRVDCLLSEGKRGCGPVWLCS